MISKFTMLKKVDHVQRSIECAVYNAVYALIDTRTQFSASIAGDNNSLGDFCQFEASCDLKYRFSDDSQVRIHNFNHRTRKGCHF